jgi:hypothetical protein
MKLDYDASKNNSYLLVHDVLKLQTDDKTSPQKTLYVSANIRQDFSDMTEEELNNAAHISFEKKAHNFGAMTDGEVGQTKFKFTNTGKSPLRIRKVESSCGCTASAPKDKVIEPGATSQINVTFNSQGKRNVVRKSITVVSNDPSNSVERLTIKAKVSPKEQ